MPSAPSRAASLNEDPMTDASADRRIAALMGAVAASLAVMSTLHFSGVLEGEEPFDPVNAGISEAVIGVLLIGGAAALLRQGPNARTVALASLGIAIVGFIVGLTFTIRGGGGIDVGYHTLVLPLLVSTLAALLRSSAG
jgi:peptidoglycan/LPS O-acetylase OafA/YrhL